MCHGIRTETLDFRESYKPLLSVSPDFCPDPSAWFSHVHKASDWRSLSPPCQFSCHSVWPVNVSENFSAKSVCPLNPPFPQREMVPPLLDSAPKSLIKPAVTSGCERPVLPRRGLQQDTRGKGQSEQELERFLHQLWLKILFKNLHGDITYNILHYRVACMLCLYACIQTYIISECTLCVRYAENRWAPSIDANSLSSVWKVIWVIHILCTCVVFPNVMSCQQYNC